MSENNEQQMVGYLCWFSVADIAAPYADLVVLAERVGFPAGCVPTPPRPSDAWRKATNTTRRGINVTPPAHLVEQIEGQYGVKPRVKLVTHVVNNKAPQLLRHLVRVAVISTADSPRQQLDMGTVAVLRFDTTSNESDLLVVPDPADYINGDVSSVVREMDERIEHLMAHATGDEVRYGLRRFLETRYALTLRDAVYFLPRSANHSLENLYAMRDFVNALGEWAVGANTPHCRVIRLEGDNACELADDIADAAVSEYTDRLNALVEAVQPVLDGRARGRVADRINRNALEEWLRIRDGLSAYRGALQVDLDVLNDLIQVVTSQVQPAVNRTFSDVDLAGENETIRRIL